MISADRSTVAFVSSANNLGPATSDEFDHVYVYDVGSGSMSLADAYWDGEVDVIGNLSAQDRPVLSSNGRRGVHLASQQPRPIG